MTPSPMKILWRVLRGLDDAEVVVYACIAAVCIVLGPIFIAWRLIAAEMYRQLQPSVWHGSLVLLLSSETFAKDGMSGSLPRFAPFGSLEPWWWGLL